MRPNKQIIFTCVLLVLTTPALANEVVTKLLQDYRNEATQPFSAETGRQLWIKSFADASGNKRSCTTCHTSDPKQTGKHARTGKRIEPLAPSVNPERLIQEREIRKWLTRNCKWTLGRECDAQEKGNLLTYLNSL
jgi:cytochrome c peroxidase